MFDAECGNAGWTSTGVVGEMAITPGSYPVSSEFESQAAYAEVEREVRQVPRSTQNLPYGVESNLLDRAGILNYLYGTIVKRYNC